MLELKIYNKEIKKRSNSLIVDKLEISLPNSGVVILSGDLALSDLSLNCLSGVEAFDGDIYNEGIILDKESRLRLRGDIIYLNESSLIRYKGIKGNFFPVDSLDYKDALSNVGLDAMPTGGIHRLAYEDKMKCLIARFIAENFKILLVDSRVIANKELSPIIMKLISEPLNDKLIIISTNECSFIEKSQAKLELKANSTITNFSGDNSSYKLSNRKHSFSPLMSYLYELTHSIYTLLFLIIIVIMGAMAAMSCSINGIRENSKYYMESNAYLNEEYLVARNTTADALKKLKENTSIIEKCDDGIYSTDLLKHTDIKLSLAAGSLAHEKHQALICEDNLSEFSFDLPGNSGINPSDLNSYIGKSFTKDGFEYNLICTGIFKRNSECPNAKLISSSKEAGFKLNNECEVVATEFYDPFEYNEDTCTGDNIELNGTNTFSDMTYTGSHAVLFNYSGLMSGGEPRANEIYIHKSLDSITKNMDLIGPFNNGEYTKYGRYPSNSFIEINIKNQYTGRSYKKCYKVAGVFERLDGEFTSEFILSRDEYNKIDEICNTHDYFIKPNRYTTREFLIDINNLGCHLEPVLGFDAGSNTDAYYRDILPIKYNMDSMNDSLYILYDFIFIVLGILLTLSLSLSIKKGYANINQYSDNKSLGNKIILVLTGVLFGACYLVGAIIAGIGINNSKYAISYKSVNYKVFGVDAVMRSKWIIQFIVVFLIYVLLLGMIIYLTRIFKNKKKIK